MPRKRQNELAAGLFVIIAVLAGVGVVIWLGGSSLWKPTHKVAFSISSNVGSLGIAPGGFVRVNDAQIGQIKTIKFDPATGKTLYLADIEPKIDLRADAAARVESAFIGSANIVLLSLGSSHAAEASVATPLELQAGGLTPAINNLSSATDQIRREFDPTRNDALISKIHLLVDQLNEIGKEVVIAARNVGNETDAQQVDSLMGKLRSSMSDFNAMTADARPKVARTLTALDETAQTVHGYAQNDLAQMFITMRQSSTAIYAATQDLAVVAGQAKGIALVNRPRIDEIVDNLASVSSNLKSASTEIRRNPWRLLYKPTDRELHTQNISDAARAFSSGAEQLDQALLKLNGLSQANPDGVRADDPQLVQVRQQLDDSFRRFDQAEQALWNELQK